MSTQIDFFHRQNDRRIVNLSRREGKDGRRGFSFCADNAHLVTSIAIAYRSSDAANNSRAA